MLQCLKNVLYLALFCMSSRSDLFSVGEVNGEKLDKG